MTTTSYKIIWRIGDIAEEIPVTYLNLEVALAAAQAWLEEMIEGVDPEDAAQDYRMDVIRVA